MGFPRQEYWSGLPFPPPGDLLNPEIEPAPPALAGEFFIPEPPGKLRWQMGYVNWDVCVMDDWEVQVERMSQLVSVLETENIGGADTGFQGKDDVLSFERVWRSLRDI